MFCDCVFSWVRLVNLSDNLKTRHSLSGYPGASANAVKSVNSLSPASTSPSPPVRKTQSCLAAAALERVGEAGKDVECLKGDWCDSNTPKSNTSKWWSQQDPAAHFWTLWCPANLALFWILAFLLFQCSQMLLRDLAEKVYCTLNHQ